MPDIVIGNAGISRGTLTGEAGDMAAFEAVFDTNVQGLVQTFQPFLAAMTAARDGVLVGVASVAGFRGLPGSGAYSASKAAAIAYLESLRVELRGTGVAVVTICPGFMRHADDRRAIRIAMPFLLAPDKAARLIARAIARRRRFYVLPWQMAWVGRVLRTAAAPALRLRVRARGAQATATLLDGRGSAGLGRHRASARGGQSAHRLPRSEPHRAPVLRCGLGECVVARTGFCVHPRDAVKAVAKVGGTKDPDLERLRALAPTHLVVNVDENRREDVDAARAFVPHVIVTHPLDPQTTCACTRCSARFSAANAKRALWRRNSASRSRFSMRRRRRCRASACSISSGASRG